VVERTGTPDASAKGSRFDQGVTAARDGDDRTQEGDRFKSRTVDWWPTCECAGETVWSDGGKSATVLPPEPVPCVVLDPFAGLCSTGVAALRIGRSFVGCELNPSYAERGRRRLANPGSLRGEAKRKGRKGPGQMDLMDEVDGMDEEGVEELKVEGVK
jgi:hypothetical protein